MERLYSKQMFIYFVFSNAAVNILCLQSAIAAAAVENLSQSESGDVTFQPRDWLTIMANLGLGNLAEVGLGSYPR